MSVVRFARWALVLGLLPVAGCNMNPATPLAQTVPSPQTAPSASSQDQAFINQAIANNIFFLQSAQYALQTSRNSRTRAYARRIIDAHTQIGDKLNDLATRNGITPPTGMGPEQEKRYGSLQNTRRIFDSEFFRQMTYAHQDGIKVFQNEISGGYNNEIKQFAQDTLVQLQAEEQDAQAGRRMPMGRTPARE